MLSLVKPCEHCSMKADILWTDCSKQLWTHFLHNLAQAGVIGAIPGTICPRQFVQKLEMCQFVFGVDCWKYVTENIEKPRCRTLQASAIIILLLLLLLSLLLQLLLLLLMLFLLLLSMWLLLLPLLHTSPGLLSAGSEIQAAVNYCSTPF